MTNQFLTPTPESRRSILAEYGEQYDRLIREKERQRITSISRTTAYGGTAPQPDPVRQWRL